MNDLDNSNLFFKIYRNLYLKNEIFKHVKLYNNYWKDTVVFRDINKYNSFKFKEYLLNLEYSFRQHIKIPNVEILKIGNSFWDRKKLIESIPENFIPSSVKDLTIKKPGYYNNTDPKERLGNIIPPTVTKLNLREYNNPLNPGDIVKTLKSLTISMYILDELKKSLWPDELELDEFIISSYRKIKNDCYFPKNYKSLEVSGYAPHIFNINLLSLSLVKLKIELPKLSSMNLSTLKNLKYLSVQDFNGDIKKGFLPVGLETLCIKNNFKFQIGSLPKSLKKLNISSYNNKIELGVLPEGLETLYISGETEEAFEVGVFPSSITYLDFGAYSKSMKKLKVGVLPLSLKMFLFPDVYSFEIDEGLLPHSMETLMLPKSFNQIITKTLLPNKLVHLDFGESFNSPIPPNTLPETLRSLTFGFVFNQDIDRFCFPNSIESIIFKSGFNKPLKAGCWPTSLTTLFLGTSFNSDIEPYALPQSLRRLSIEGPFNKYFEPNTLPLSLLSIRLPSLYNKEIDIILPKLTHLKIGTTNNSEYFLKRDKDYSDSESLLSLLF
ncbi:hypothetical protein DDB_G0284637 [Dictyostelium discoideum AX4]|uniref:FNIP repeat-containing protein n=1 Tax=Dictyostelium discoideum TaxID=44689 RepID=Q54PD0_DICDI|nr:hypothetical protein DDB_G0284637 [Dictyostelium discoideum AX4]EAL65088.1 hypothetical protein DDB_G0284637 [Dictyostelium discoideum AX4]|eukprot:XP_638445.1 hypothetical protein DDB_G0284637 [Dictyostelium discoideum AX4]